MGTRQNLIGKEFFWLKVIGYDDEVKKWICRCRCGKEVFRTTSHLNENVKHSCGCRGRQYHHMGKTRFNHEYQRARARCNNKNRDSYKYYGGRGIKFTWDKFEDFKKDMYDSYLQAANEFGENNLSLDRIDNNKDYCKENCRWVKLSSQSRNRRCIKLIDYKGKLMTKSEIEKERGVYHGYITRRIRLGQSIDEIINLHS